MAEDIVAKILQTLNAQSVIEDSNKFAKSAGLDPKDVVGAVNQLLAFEYVDRVATESKVLVLTPDGEDVVQRGSPEAQYFNAVPAGDGILKKDLDDKFGPTAKLAFPAAMQAKWVAFDKGTQKVTRTVESITDVVATLLKEMQANPNGVSEQDKSNLKRRRMLNELTVKSFRITKGANFKPTFKKPVADLTTEMLASGAWKTETFKDYNFDTMGLVPTSGHLHPLLKVRAEIRSIFLEMGFAEMPTNNYVESSFWNFDTLFQPQQHPARDAHDTFFLSDPATSTQFPADYLKRVEEVHTRGGHGSIGWRYDWKVEEAQKNILRTHTTAVSSRMLYALAQGGFKPAKYFSIDRVFRNETLDLTHLAEFHQIEGLVADYNITLSNLLGIISQFFERLGISNVRFKPAYNPYTEPSMEIFGFHPVLKRWVEIGNSGMFRPEMLRPMGLPENVNVIAWGLSLERPTMIKYNIGSIRSIFGPRIDLDFIKKNPVCFMDT